MKVLNQFLSRKIFLYCSYSYNQKKKKKKMQFTFKKSIEVRFSRSKIFLFLRGICCQSVRKKSSAKLGLFMQNKFIYILCKAVDAGGNLYMKNFALFIVVLFVSWATKKYLQERFHKFVSLIRSFVKTIINLMLGSF